MTENTDKMNALEACLRGYGSALVAFSGGVDSTFLLKIAAKVLGDRVVAATAVSPTFLEHEQDEAAHFARDLGVRQITVHSNELELEAFRDNPPDRCYHCKHELFSQLKRTATENGLNVVCDGTNADDLGDHRPGRRACRELGIASPLLDCGFTKDEIRSESRKLGLPTWNKPAFACLASRFPYGTPITAEKLKVVGRAENLLRELGFVQFRVRHHGDVARIEVAPEAFSGVIADAQRISQEFKALGFKYVALDLDGYRTGSMNEVLDKLETDEA